MLCRELELGTGTDSSDRNLSADLAQSPISHCSPVSQATPRPQKNLSNRPNVECYQTQRASINIAEAQVFAVSQRPEGSYTRAP